MSPPIQDTNEEIPDNFLMMRTLSQPVIFNKSQHYGTANSKLPPNYFSASQGNSEQNSRFKYLKPDLNPKSGLDKISEPENFDRQDSPHFSDETQLPT